MAFFGAALLVFIIIVRPQEFVPGLASVGLLNIATGIAVLGIAVEIGLGKLRRLGSPQLPFVFAFLIWCYVTVIVRAGFGSLQPTHRTIFFSTLFMLIVMLACRTLFRLKAMMGLLLVLGLFLAYVGITQAHSEMQCIQLDPEDVKKGERTKGEPTGRPCVLSRLECDAEDRALAADYNAEEFEYVCEKPGPFQTFSVAHGRVRWRGILSDPNELSTALGAALAIAFGFFFAARGKTRYLVMLGVISLVTYCVVRTQSRTGMIVIAAVLGLYFIRRFGLLKGIIVAAMGAAPLLMLGGRAGEEADASSEERAGALWKGVELVKQYPLFGVGRGLFADHYFITAHNSYLLTGAELGFPGMILWSILMYLTLKIPFVLTFRPPEGTPPKLREFAIALLVSLVAFLIGIAFLSFAYHSLLWIYIGVSGALYGVARETIPSYRVGLSKKEAVYIAIGDVAIIVLLFVYTRVKGV